MNQAINFLRYYKLGTRKEIRKNLYKIEHEKSLSESKVKEIERNLTELEETLSKTKKIL